jgi:hypothetical protein
MVEWGANPDLVEGPEPPAAERSIHYRADDHQAKGAHYDRDNDPDPDDHRDDNHHRTVTPAIQLSGGWWPASELTLWPLVAHLQIRIQRSSRARPPRRRQ